MHRGGDDVLRLSVHTDLQRRVRRERQDSMRQGRPRRDGDVRDLDGVAAAAVATAAVAVAAATHSYYGPAAATLYVYYNMLDRRLQLYLVGDNLGHHTHDHDQVSAGSSHTACPATHAAHITSLTNLHAGPLLLFAATARITRRRVSTQTMPSGARARTRSLSTPATTRPSRRALPHSAPSLASRTMVA